MDTSKETGWATLFGSSTKTKQGESESFDPNKLVQDTPKKIDVMRQAFGKNIIQKIKFSQKMLKSKGCVGIMRHEVEDAYNHMLRAVSMDITNLVDVLVFAKSVSFVLFNKDARFIMKSIISNLDQLILKQAEMLRKIHCPVKIRTSASIQKELEENLYKSAIELINQGEYLQAMPFLVGTYHIIKPEQANQLYSVALNASQKYLTYSDAFLEVLKIRLFSQHNKTPHLIEYDSLQGNMLLESQSLEQIRKFELLPLSEFIESAVSCGGYLWEEKLKNNYHSMILAKVESLANLIEQIKANDNHLPFLGRPS